MSRSISVLAESREQQLEIRSLYVRQDDTISIYANLHTAMIY